MQNDLIQPPSPGSRLAGIGFDPSLRDLTKLAVKGVLLNVATLGFYRFWYMTDLRRFFWGRTTVDGSPLEYTGRGEELFLGFIICVVILLPVYSGVFLASLFLTNHLLISILIFSALFILGQFASYRGRRYRASRTLWRGIRFSQDGSALCYAARATGWWAATMLTAGLAFPFMRADLERYRIRHTLMGTARLESSANGRVIFKNWLLIYAVGIFPILICLASFYVENNFKFLFDLHVPHLDTNNGFGMNTTFRQTYVHDLASVLLMITVCAVGLVVLLFPYYRAKEMRAFISSISYKNLKFVSYLRVDQFYEPYFLYIALVIAYIIFVVGSVFVFGPLLAYKNEINNQFYAMSAPLVMIYLSYILAVFIFFVLHVRIVRAGLWAAIARTTQISDPDMLNAVTASSRSVGGRLNEGMADALDVAGAIEIGF